MKVDFHCLQKPHQENLDYGRSLSHSLPTAPYRRRCKENKTLVHVGQLKLLASELEFMIEVSKRYSNGIIVYAGAAPGMHLDMVVNLYPNFEYILYDPRPFQVTGIADGIKISYRNEFFLEESARQIVASIKSNKNIFLISDIRTENTSEAIIADNLLMMNCSTILKPKLSMFKFRFPFAVVEKILYYDGDIRFQIFAGNTSTETRLLVTHGAKQREYDTKKIEEQMFYFNTVIRPNKFSNPREHNLPGLDGCYDCTTLINIIKQLPIDKIGSVREFYMKIVDRLHLQNRKVYISYDDKRYGIPFTQLGFVDPNKALQDRYVWQSPIVCHPTSHE